MSGLSARPGAAAHRAARARRARGLVGARARGWGPTARGSPAARALAARGARLWPSPGSAPASTPSCAPATSSARPSSIGEAGARIAVPGSALLAAALRRRGLRVHVGPLALDGRILGPAERRGHAGRRSPSTWSRPGSRPARRPRRSPSCGSWPTQRAATSPTRAWRSPACARSAACAGWAARSTSGPRRSGRARVLLAGPRSFCAGVERAIDIVERALAQRGAPVYVRKQIVHNEHVVADLERRGAVFVEELDEVPGRRTVVFSAHGVSPAVRREARRARGST